MLMLMLMLFVSQETVESENQKRRSVVLLYIYILMNGMVEWFGFPKVRGGFFVALGKQKSVLQNCPTFDLSFNRWF